MIGLLSQTFSNEVFEVVAPPASRGQTRGRLLRNQKKCLQPHKTNNPGISVGAGTTDGQGGVIAHPQRMAVVIGWMSIGHLDGCDTYRPDVSRRVVVTLSDDLMGVWKTGGGLARVRVTANPVRQCQVMGMGAGRQ